MNERSVEERLKQCVELTRKIRSLGLNGSLSGSVEFSKISNEFIRNGVEYDGIIKFIEDPTIKLIVSLRRSKNVDCSIRIKRSVRSFR